MTKVSVVVPIYNTEKYLRRCIDSLINQTIDGIEIILVNDASTDGCLDIIEEYQKEYPEKVKTINSTINKRQGGARNLGVEIATGEYLGFVDSDDYVDFELYEKMYNEAISNNYDYVECDWFVDDEEKHTKKVFHSLAIIGNLAIEKKRELIINATSIWTKIYKTKIFKEKAIKFPEFLSYEDIPLIVSTPIFFDNRGKVNEPLYYYVKRPESTTTLKNSMHHFDRLDTTLYLIKDLKQRDLYELYKEEIDYQYIKRAYLVTIMTCLKKYDRVNFGYLYIARKNIKENLNKYKNNKYMDHFSKYQRALLYANDLHPYFMVLIYRLFGEYEMMKQRFKDIKR